MRLRTVNSIILPSAHKVKASARNSVTTVVGGGEMLPLRHWLAQPRGRGPSQTPPSLATDSSLSPGPPLSLAAGTVHQCRVLTATPPPGAANAEGKPPCGHLLGRGISAAWVQAWRCKGRSPLHKKTKKSPPSPPGKGGGGIGGKSKAKGMVGRRQRGQAPRLAPAWQAL